MLKFETANRKLVAVISDQEGRTRRKDLSPLRSLRNWQKLLPILERQAQGKRPATQITHFMCIKTYFVDALPKLGITALPVKTGDWQDFVMRLYEHAITRNDIQSSLESRCRAWEFHVAKFLLILRDYEDIIPATVEIPIPPRRLEIADLAGYETKLLGENTLRPIHSETVNKLLVNISTSRTDAEYLNILRDELTFRRQLLFNVLLRS